MQQIIQLTPAELLQRLIFLTKQKQKYLDSLIEPQTNDKIIPKQISEAPKLIQNHNSILIQGESYNIDGLDQSILDYITQNFSKSDLTIQQSKINNITSITQYTFIQFFLTLWQHKDKPSEGKTHIKDLCSICQFQYFELGDDIKYVKQIELKHFELQMDNVVMMECNHQYHLNCLEMCLKENHVQCSICSRIYGIKEGDQPQGIMNVHLDNSFHCESYENTGTIVINYQMFEGWRDGQQFAGTHRTSYLPDIKEGRQILRLLKKAYTRKLIFTVGTSVTSGQSNQTVWNGIHHKTKTYGGSANFGYPDPTYFSRVRLELASKGVM